MLYNYTPEEQEKIIDYVASKGGTIADVLELRKSEITNILNNDTNPYKNILKEEDYNSLLSSGMFREFHPELSGNREQDKHFIHNAR